MPTISQKYTQVAVINNTTTVSDTDGSNMVVALNMLLPNFCSDWSISDVSAVYIPRGGGGLPRNVHYIYLTETSDVADALAYHTFTNDTSFGKVFVKTILENNGVIMYDPDLTRPTVAQALSHEVFELLIDPMCNSWWMNYNTGLLYASEVCDPIESNVIVVNIPNGIMVGLSDWILPAWQDSSNTAGPFNYMNTLTAPFQVKNGYAMVIKDSTVTSIYGEPTNPTRYSHCRHSQRFAKRRSAMKPV
jgi:hypothetical protein